MRAFRMVQGLLAAAMGLGLTACTSGPPVSARPSDPAVLQEPAPWTASEAVALRNGLWFDGQRFRPREVVYIVDGRLSRTRPRKTTTRTVDLMGGFVLPPLGDAHTHVFDGPGGFPGQRSQYLKEGVFYALTTTAPASGVAKIRHRLSGAKNVDVANAQAGFTGPKSHPAEIYNAYALGVFDWRQQHARWDTLRSATAAADDAYFVVRTPADLEAKWELVRKRRPDLIKVFLRSSDRYRPEGPSNLAAGGMNPDLLAPLVLRAHAAGLRVAVANSNLSDFRVTLAAGADMVTHLPCYQGPGEPGPYDDSVPDRDATCLLSRNDARRAARARLVSTLVTSEWGKSDRSPAHARWEAANVAALSAAGAPLAIGSNAYGQTPVEGLVAAGRRGTFTRAQLLRWATMATPRAVHPTRKIGCLTAGCEASFLVLAANPLADMGALRTIRLRVKDGLLLTQQEIEAK